jgi:hypothetical protein
MARGKIFEKSSVVAMLFVIAFPVTPAGADTAGARRLHSRNAEVTLLIAEGARYSPTLARLLARLDSTPWLVFVDRGKCPAKNAVGCLLHRVGHYQGQPYLLIVVDNRRLEHPHSEISTIAHELQHALEVAEHATAAEIDSANISDVFRRIGKVSGTARRVTVFETDAARQVGYRVLTELAIAGRRADGKF